MQEERDVPIMFRIIMSPRLPAIIKRALWPKLTRQRRRWLHTVSASITTYQMRGKGALTSTLSRFTASAKNSSEKETMRPPRATDDTSVDVSLNSCWNWSRGIEVYVGLAIVFVYAVGDSWSTMAGASYIISRREDRSSGPVGSQ